MSEAKYILLTTVKKEVKNVKWWDSHTKDSEEVRIFDSFEEAKNAMVEAIKTLTKKNAFFPFKRGRYQPYEEFWRDCEYGEDPQDVFFRDVLTSVLKDPGSKIEGVEKMDYQDTDDGDWYFAFVGNKKRLLADYYEHVLDTNIHNISDELQTYYFVYRKTDDYGIPLDEISVRLLNTGKK